MDQYKRVGVPLSGYEMMNFPDEQAELIQKYTEQAENNGDWESARDVKIDLSDAYFWAYWLNKSAHPVEKPLLGHGELKSMFEPFRKDRFVLNGGTEGETRTVCTTGDLMCTAGLERSKNVLYEDVEAFLFDADVCYANLESTFSDAEVTETRFGGDDPPKINLTVGQYKTLSEHKGRTFDVVQLANNHIIDCGEGGVQKTLAQLAADGIAQVGVNLSEEQAQRTTITEKAGLKIGWVSHTMFVNFRPLPEGKPWLVNITPFHIEADPDLSKILTQIRYCRSKDCDLIIVSLHWGLEFEFWPHPDERKWAQIFADAGADIIIGQHPHVIQFSEILHPAYDLTKDVPVIYSQGNLTPVISGPGCALSNLARFTVCRKAGRVRVTEVKLLPVAVVEHVMASGTRPEIKKLKTLTEILPGMDADMQEYVRQMARYADMILGDSWRT